MTIARIFLLLGALLLPAATLQAAEEKPTQPNVLFIAIDDLNHWVGHLHRNPQTHTPNIDRLASMGVTFTNANCSAPVCNASRAALMSGMKPSTTGVYDNGQNWKSVVSIEQTLTTQFLNAGYNVYGAGKIYHAQEHRPGEWTDYYANRGKRLQMHPSANGRGVGGIRFGPLANSDSEMPDYQVVDYALKKLDEKHDKPFFLAVGLVKPHMAWSVPKKYFDEVPLDSIKLPPTTENDLSDVPPPGIELAHRSNDHAKMLKSGRWDEAVQAYLATIRFADAQVGRLMEGLDKSDYRDNTIVVLWGDHGWHLGEKEHWRKFALWEEACRAPLVWVAPGVTTPGTICERPVDFMTVYPTLCDLTGVPIPDHVEGPSIVPLLKDASATWDQPALTTFHRDNHSFRSEKFRYIRYADGSEELYDHDEDPYEWTNLAGDARYDSVKKEFLKYVPSNSAEELPKGRR